MKITDTISVNPSKTALGHTESTSSPFFRSQVISVENPSNSVDILKLVFPTYRSGLGELTKYEVPLRTLFATILIVIGISMLVAPYTTQGVAFAICTLCFGGFLALGLLTRPIMIGAAIYYCVSGAISLRMGAPDISVFSLMFGCILFGILGSGKYSCDSLIRGAIKHSQLKNDGKNKENFLGYKAFHKVRI